MPVAGTTRIRRPRRSGWSASSRGLPTQWAAMTAISGRLGMSPETLRKWMRQAEIDGGEAPGVSSAESAEMRELRRKNRELEQTIEILKAATSFFARECDPRHR